MKITRFLTFLLVLFEVIGCAKKKNSTILTDIQFLPIKENISYMHPRYKPFIRDKSFIVPLLTTTIINNTWLQFDFTRLLNSNLVSNEITLDAVNKFGSNYILDYLHPMNSDLSMGVIYKDPRIIGSTLVYDTAGLRVYDKNFNIVFKTPILRVGEVDGITSMNNGNYLITYYAVPGRKTPSMACYDSQLNLLWNKTLTLKYDFVQLGGSNGQGVCVSHDRIFLVDGQALTTFIINEYDMNGDFIRSIYPKPGEIYSNTEIVATDSGFVILSLDNNVLDSRQLLFSSYDYNGNLILSKTLSMGSLLSMMDNYKFGFASNIIFDQGNLYFTVGIYPDLNSFSETKLIKINSNLEFAWSKLLDSKRRLRGEFLVLYDKNLINIGETNWNGIDGLSIIKTDMDGNIRK